ncbi:MAG: hypothetical protein PHF51_04895 [Candidatus ainarchaeum sp.]|nr:hypothetical protein [Candidatus ainarchaeum sp.]
MDIIKALMAGAIVGLVAGLLGGALQVVGSIPILGFCVCMVQPLTWVLMWFLFPLAAGVAAIMMAKDSTTSIVDALIQGVIAGAVYAVVSWLIGFVVGIALLVILQLVNVATTNQNAGDIITGAIAALFVNIVGTLIGLALVFVTGIFWGAVGGAAGSFLFKPNKAQK